MMVDKTMVSFRVTKQTKYQLEQLARKKAFKLGRSVTVSDLIKYAIKKSFGIKDKRER